MIVIYGHRTFGRVDAYNGEYAHTRFFHIYYMPLIPLGSWWVTRESGRTFYGVPIKLNGKSVLAAYLRAAGVVAAIALLACIGAGNIAGASIATAVVAASAWAWSWRSLHGAVRRKRSDVRALAYGVHCDPAMLKRDTRTSIQRDVDERWQALELTRTPEDVARFGPATRREAVLAYARLELAAIEHRDRAAREAADKLLAGAYEQLPPGDGPYREAAQLAANTPIAASGGR